MRDETENLVLRLLRDIGAEQACQRATMTAIDRLTERVSEARLAEVERRE